ncbi:protein O-mannosyl-transferase 2-like [Centruroides sculpturatus]|uniref:protein O-mannosyl-transferase 2-like n=1 Tax=Centruroides sculpturatus TaxID=218467 RepID=UPI000C6E2390|nr:protein O-mannosyl-transferase 2-like [Centruroides sculpturatus]
MPSKDITRSKQNAKKKEANGKLEEYTKGNTNYIWILTFSSVVLLTTATRLYKIHEPDHVCWDETHFGKMGSWYINHTFFFDVHPPLGKMLIGLSGVLTGYNGTFPFNKPGDKYGDHNYVGMRIVSFTDVGVLTLSQYILLDPIMMFFIIGSVLGMAKFHNMKEKSFSFQWWFWLCWTGIFLACAISMPRQLAYGAIITLKNHRTGGGYLHSHWHLYPEGIGARQQQVTAYSHKDDNNKWIVKWYDRQPNLESKNEPIEFVRNGDLIRLEHLVTTRNLHSHKEVAPITKRHHQVSCYGENGTGDANDVWKVEVVGGKEHEIITTVTSKLKFIHYLTGCALHSHSKQLPKWGYEQMEVTCNPNIRDKNNLWNVEDNFFPRLPNVSFEVYAPSFLERFLESHAVMLQGNAGLKPKEGEVTSRPWQWPINYRGQFFSGHQYRIYLLGNPIIWWGNLICLAIYMLVQGYISVRYQRGYKDSQYIEEQSGRMSYACRWLLLGWILHYLPFYAMGRVLYFHHYFPALLFNSMLSGVILNYLLFVLPTFFPSNLAHSCYHWLLGTSLAVLAYSFYLFQPLSYGMEGPVSNSPNSTMYGLKWLESWEF